MPNLNTLLTNDPALLNKLQTIGILEELNQLLEQTRQNENVDWEQEFSEIIAKGQIATASLRAPEGYHLPQTMQQFPELFTKFGGHPGAAGFSAYADNLPAIRDGFAKGLHSDEQSAEILYVDSEIINILPPKIADGCRSKSAVWIGDCSNLNDQFLRQVLAMDPFGQDFPMPELVIRLNCQDCRNYRFMGSSSNHLKITLPNNLCITYFSIGEDQILTLKNYFEQTLTDDLYIIARVSQNTWNNQTKLELIASSMEY